MPIHRLSPTLLALALGAAFPIQSAVAQATPEASKEVSQLGAVIVTGSRRAENLKDVPLSISAIKSEELDTYNASGQDIRALSGKVPSLNIESDYGRTFPRFYVRGLGNTDFDMNASQPVGLVYDDVVQESIALKGFPVFDMAQVELLRGPQGTLFGRNSPAGVMKFDSARPTKRLEGYANLGFGRWSALNLETAVNVPVNNELQLRVAGIVQRQSDRVHNPMAATAGATADFEGYNDKAVRVQALYKSGSFEGLFKVQARDFTGTATTFRANISKKGTNELVDGYDDSYYPTDGYNSQTLSSSEVSARLRWDFDGLSLYSVTSHARAKFYSRGDVDGGFGSDAIFGGPKQLPMGPNYPGQPAYIPFDSQTADGIPTLRQTTQEFRLQSNTNDPMQWILGLYYFNEKQQVDTFGFDTFAAGDPQISYAVQHQQARSWAAFGNVKFAVTPDLKLTAGLRYTDDKKDFDAARTQGFTTVGPLLANPQSTNWSWDLGANYSLTGTTSLFARVATGYRAPSIQGRVLFGDTISVANSEKVLSVEAGFKADLLDNTARITGTLFKYRVKDMQLTAGSGGINQNRLINAAKAEGQGFELDAQAILGRDWRTTLGFSYNDTQIKDAALFVAPCGNGCTVLDPAGPLPGTVSINGNDLPRAPKIVWNWTLKYSTALANGELTVLTDWAFKDKYNMFLYEAVEYRAKSAVEGGLRVGYGWANGKYEVAAFGRNITNHRQIVAAIDFNNLTGIVNEPRSYGVQFKASF
ncbi:MAG: TonB-dependent receptor [Rubrivivax sp.]|nr:MAG: TonB-dependent receptor [Rubrivivax sp.]